MRAGDRIVRQLLQNASDNANVIHFNDEQLNNIVRLTPRYAWTIGSIGLIGAACSGEVLAWGSNADVYSKNAIRDLTLGYLSNRHDEVYRDKELRPAYNLYYALLAAEFAGNGNIIYRGTNMRNMTGGKEEITDPPLDRLYREILITGDARPVKGLYRFLIPGLLGFFAKEFNNNRENLEETKSSVTDYLLRNQYYNFSLKSK